MIAILFFRSIVVLRLFPAFMGLMCFFSQFAAGSLRGFPDFFGKFVAHLAELVCG